MYLQHFGLKFDPLGKSNIIELAQSKRLEQQLNGLLETRGLAVITGDSGTGKTTALRYWSNKLNPLTHQVIYQSDTHFRSFDVYSQLAENLGLENYYRFSKLWRDLKQSLIALYHDKNVQPIWILDEAHQLSNDFILRLPDFLNFSFDSKDVMTIILCGLPSLLATLQRPAYEPINSRIQCFIRWHAIEDSRDFESIIHAAFEKAGMSSSLFTETGIRAVHMATKGRLRYVDRLMRHALLIAANMNLNHIPDDVINQAIHELKG